MRLLAKKFASLLLCLTLVLCLCSCGKTNDTTSKISVPSTTAVGENGSRSDKAVGFQLEKPADGETIVVFETTHGNISIRLFPDEAPLAVENFIRLVEKGYYDNITFHRVINNFMIQGGDPTGTGTAGESIWGADFEDEFNSNLINIRGSLSMANSGKNTNGSQFFINQATTCITKDTAIKNEQQYNESYEQAKAYYNSQYTQYVQAYGATFTSMYPDFETYFSQIYYCAPVVEKVPDEVWELYGEHGGNISLDGAFRNGGGHTVFGQVFEGMDTVDKIAAVTTDENNKPLENVVIKKAYTQKYSATATDTSSEVSSDVSSN